MLNNSKHSKEKTGGNRINKSFLALISIASIAFFGFIAMMIMVLCGYNFAIDNFNKLVANNRNEFWNEFFKIFTHLGSFYTLLILTIVGVLLIWFVMKNKRMSSFYALCFGKVCLASLIFKLVIKRIRPEHFMIINQMGYSFPSGHAMMSLAFFVIVSHFVWKTIKNKPLKIALISIFMVVAIMIGFSRVYLGVHYLSDILAGWLLTTAIFVSSLIVYNSKMFKALKDKE